MNPETLFSRRHFLAAASLGSGSLLVPDCLGHEKAPRPKVAAIYTVFTHRSHAHVILEKFLRPYLFNAKRIQPPVEVVSFYPAQIAKQVHMTREVAKQFKIPVHKPITDTLPHAAKTQTHDPLLS